MFVNALPICRGALQTDVIPDESLEDLIAEHLLNLVECFGTNALALVKTCHEVPEHRTPWVRLSGRANRLLKIDDAFKRVIFSRDSYNYVFAGKQCLCQRQPERVRAVENHEFVRVVEGIERLTEPVLFLKRHHLVEHGDADMRGH